MKSKEEVTDIFKSVFDEFKAKHIEFLDEAQVDSPNLTKLDRINSECDILNAKVQLLKEILNHA